MFVLTCMLDYVDLLYYKNPEFIVLLVFSTLDAKELSITTIKVFFLRASL